MKVAILGMGGIGLGLAAVLARKRIDVSLWTAARGKGSPNIERNFCLIASGALEGEFRFSATSEIAEAISGATVVILAVPGNAHKQVIDLAVPCLESHQTLIISSQMSFSALYLSQRLQQQGLTCLVIAWATTAITASRTAPASVQISSIRGRLTMCALPSSRSGEALALCEDMLGKVFHKAPDLLAATLSNINPPAHMANALCNLTRMEYGEDWGAYRGMSAAVGRLIEALDVERLRLAAALGFTVHTVQDHLHTSFGLPYGSVAEMAAEQNRRRNGGPPGPKTLDHRFVTEDIPFGIVPVLEISKVAEVEMPLHNAGLMLMSALYGRDFFAENDILGSLELARMTRRRLQKVSRDGYVSIGRDD